MNRMENENKSCRKFCEIPVILIDVLTFKRLPRFSVVQQGLCLVPEHLSLDGIVLVVEGVDEDAPQVPGQLVLFPQDPVKLRRPELLRDRGVRLHPANIEGKKRTRPQICTS